MREEHMEVQEETVLHMLQSSVNVKGLIIIVKPFCDLEVAKFYGDFFL